MTPPRDVFLLGAGFARAISPEMPLLQDLADRVLATEAVRAKIAPEIVAMMHDNFAHALSYLEQAKPWISEADNLRHRALYLECSHAIAQDLDATVRRVASRLAAHIPPWLQQLLRTWHTQRSVVLTLNYDTLVESLAATLSLSGGRLTAQQLYPPLLTDAALRATGDRRPPARPTFRLLKLHGSTNWYYSGRRPAQGEPIYFVPPLPLRGAPGHERAHHAFRLSAVADKYPLLVPPVYNKTALLTHETVRALWFEGGEALKHATRIVSLGYSLPESDVTMKHFLRTTCSERAEIIVVDPAADAVDNFRRVFRDSGVRITSYARGKESVARFAHEELRSKHLRRSRGGRDLEP